MDKDINTLSDEDLKYIKSGEFANEMFNEVFTYDYAKEIAGEGLKNVRDVEFKKRRIDSQPAIIIKALGEKSSLLVDLEAYTINYMIIYENYLINIGVFILTAMNSQAGSGTGLENVRDNDFFSIDDLDKHIEKYELLSQLIANSLIIKDQW